MPERTELRVALAGFGAIGGAVGRRLDRGLPGLRLAAISARDVARAEARLADFAAPVPVLGLAALADHADVVVDAPRPRCSAGSPSLRSAPAGS